MNARRHAGFTLMETLVAALVFAVIAVGLGSAVLMSARAMPASSAGANAAARAGLALDEVCGDLKYATQIDSSSATHVAFKVADRDGDGVAESIRYEWGGSAGDAITRTYNGAVTTVLDGADAFEIALDRERHAKVEQTEVVQDSGEVLLSAFNGWSIISLPTVTSLPISSSTWSGEYFRIDRVSLPADLTQFAITKVRVKLRRVTTPAGTTVSAGIYQPAAAGGPFPSTTRVGSESTLNMMDLPTAFSSTYTDFVFSNVTFTSPQTEFVFVIKGSSTGGAVLQYYTAALAPTDTQVYVTTTNSGGTWGPSKNRQENDMPYEVWGRYQRRTTAEVEVESFTLRSASIAVVPSAEPATRLTTAVETLNNPAVSP